MKIFKVSLTVTMTVVILSVGAAGQVQKNSLDFSEDKLKSPVRAAQYSMMGVLLPIAAGVALWQIDSPDSPYGYENPDRTIPVMLIVSGVVLGPSAGYFYGGCPERGATGILIRVGTGALTAVAAKAAADAHESDGFMDFSGLEAALTVGAIGSGIIVIEAIADMALVKGAVEKKNIRIGQQKGPEVTLLPTYFADSGATGLQLNVTF
ncbi:MAG: hypothetical protein JSW64_03470 [Candidatus Zixiibacteriota bacterium]|nr:MAG: hypothetical protein JSW64_03470 [candidate division Zixibacteria bacterium]